MSAEAVIARLRVYDPVLKFRPKIVTIRKPGKQPYSGLANDPRNIAFETEVRVRARMIMAGRRLITDRVNLDLLFGLCDAQQGDLDNFAKATIDGLVGGLMQDDRQVWEVHARRETIAKKTRPWVEIEVRLYQDKKKACVGVGSATQAWPQRAVVG